MDLATQLDAVRDRYRPANRITPKREWYRIDNKADTRTATIWIHDEIGWFGITGREFIEDLMAIDADTIDLHLNSPGGEVFDGIAIYSTLRQHSAKVNVIIDSLAASIASVIAMAGDTVTVTPNGMMMIHDGLGLAIGNAADHRDMADLLDKISDNIASVYAERATGDKTADEWRALMLAETWFNADEALEAGLVDAISTPSAADAVPDDEPAATADFDLSVFADHLLTPTVTPEPVDVPDETPTIQLDTAEMFSAIREAVTQP